MRFKIETNKEAKVAVITIGPMYKPYRMCELVVGN